MPSEPWLSVVPPHPSRTAAVLAFPGRIVVAADVTPEWVHARLPEPDPSAPLNPPFLAALCARLHRRVSSVDLVMLAPPDDGDPPIALVEAEDRNHPRVRRARRYRDAVRVFATPGGVLVLGQGLGGRWEVAIEVDEPERNAGLGRRLAAAARRLSRTATGGRAVWAQVAPGNAAGVRAFLAAGYRPVGAEALLVTLVSSGPAPRSTTATTN